MEDAMRISFLGELLLPAGLLFLIAAGDAPQFQVDHPWARASAGAAKTGAAYLTITDQGQPDRLTGASTPIADAAELHESMADMGTMKMRPLAGLTLAPGKPVKLAPGGYHVMLMGLKAPLKTGDTFPLTLRFEHAPPMTVTVAVEPLAATH
jgi:copper(I)-binding protein